MSAVAERPEAPFTAEQVAHINEFQRAGYMHPFTCGNSHGGDRNLYATEAGMRCHVCDYRQNWVHDFMADGKAVAGYRQMFAASGIDARQRPDREAGLDPEGESPVAATSGETPNLPADPPE